MINKYIYLPTTLGDNTSPSYYSSAMPAAIPAEEIPYYYRARDGERLDNISYKFYGTPNYWWLIAKANNLVNGTLSIPAGKTLRIPNL